MLLMLCQMGLLVLLLLLLLLLVVVVVLSQVTLVVDSSGGTPSMSMVNVDDVLRAFDAFCDAPWLNLPSTPRTADSSAVICTTYARWFTSPGDVDHAQLLRTTSDLPAYVSWPGRINASHLQSLMRFRLSAHTLPGANQSIMGLRTPETSSPMIPY